MTVTQKKLPFPQPEALPERPACLTLLSTLVFPCSCPQPFSIQEGGRGTRVWIMPGSAELMNWVRVLALPSMCWVTLD